MAGEPKHGHLQLSDGPTSRAGQHSRVPRSPKTSCHRGTPGTGTCKDIVGLQEGHTSNRDEAQDHVSPGSPQGGQQKGSSKEPGWF